jgi:membrane protein implicated in regulation of membrane protease activity
MIEAAMAFFIIFLIGLIFVVGTALMSGMGHVGGGDTDASSSDFSHGDTGGGDSGHGDMGGDSDSSGGHDTGGHDAGHHEGGIHFPRLSPLMIACSMTIFGGFGWIFLIFLPQIQLIGAIIGGLVMAAIISAALFYGFIRAMSRVQASSVYKLSESLNTVGTVSTPMTPGRIGVVEHVLRGQVVSTSAKSDDVLHVGDQVLIKDVQGDIILVKKLTERPERATTEDIVLGLAENPKEEGGK